LAKLSVTKRMRDHTGGNGIHKRRSLSGSTKYDPIIHPNDQIVTFLICQKFTFNYDNLHNEIREFYNNEGPHRYWHNLLLSIEDGILLYNDPRGQVSLYPEINERSSTVKFILPADDSIDHIKAIAHFAFGGLNQATVLYPDISQYRTIPKDLPMKDQD